MAGVLDLLDGREDRALVRAWFMDANPMLGEISPVDALRHDRYEDVHAAARALVDE